MSTLKQIAIDFKCSDGITAAVAREFAVSGIGRDLHSACKEVAENLVTNSKIVLRKQANNEKLASVQEELVKERAAEFVRNQGRIRELYFVCNEVG